MTQWCASGSKDDGFLDEKEWVIVEKKDIPFHGLSLPVIMPFHDSCVRVYEGLLEEESCEKNLQELKENLKEFDFYGALSFKKIFSPFSTITLLESEVDEKCLRLILSINDFLRFLENFILQTHPQKKIIYYDETSNILVHVYEKNELNGLQKNLMDIMDMSKKVSLFYPFKKKMYKIFFHDIEYITHYFFLIISSLKNYSHEHELAIEKCFCEEEFSEE
jgi:hypothetical protein